MHTRFHTRRAPAPKATSGQGIDYYFCFRSAKSDLSEVGLCRWADPEIEWALSLERVTSPPGGTQEEQGAGSNDLPGSLTHGRSLFNQHDSLGSFVTQSVPNDWGSIT